MTPTHWKPTRTDRAVALLGVVFGHVFRGGWRF